MRTFDRLEAGWAKLGQEIREYRARIKNLIAEFELKKEKFEKLAEARRVLLLDSDTSEAGAKLLLDRLEEDASVSAPMPPTQTEAARRYVCESLSNEGVSAKEVAEALHKLGYGGTLTWKNFYSSVTMALNRLSERTAIQKRVDTGVGRNVVRFFRPPDENPAISILKDEPR
jgi:hypothetical protein